MQATLAANRELTPEELCGLGPNRLLVRVRSINYLAENINAYEVGDPDGRDLPGFTAGSHIDLYFRDGRVRQYSLCNDPLEQHRYVFVVQRELHGRGGSKAIFERIHVGRVLAISQPRNLFQLDSRASHSVFLAGGIGITPIISMLRHEERAGRSFELHYCTRSRERTAFFDELTSLRREGRAFIYHDDGNPARGPDLRGLLEYRRAGTHLYYCGPAGFMKAVAEACAHWPRESVHCEHFSVPDDERGNPQARPTQGALAERDVEAEVSTGFEVRLARSGFAINVPNDKSIVQVLREHGVNAPTSCESGLCGTCRTRYLEGTPEHRDYILDDETRRTHLLICCSRSRSQYLVLDL